MNNLKVDQSLSQFTTSDHFLISFDFHCCFSQSVHYKTTKKFNYFRADFSDIECYFLDFNFEFISSAGSTNNAWSFLKDSLLYACDLYIPTCSLHSNKYPPWFNADIKHLLNKIHTLRRRLKKKTTQQKTANLNSMELTLQCLIAMSKDLYISNLINSFSHKPRKLYQFLKFFKSEPTTTFLFNNSRATHDPSLLVNHLTTFSTLHLQRVILPYHPSIKCHPQVLN